MSEFTLETLNNITRELSINYPVLKNVKIKIVQNNGIFIGKCDSVPYGEYMYIGKMRYKNSITSCITLLETDKNIMFTFFHEITHAITPYYERKVKNNWIRMDHSDKFYKNFMDIMKYAYEKKYINKTYNLSELKKRDNYKENVKSDRQRFNSNKCDKYCDCKK